MRCLQVLWDGGGNVPLQLGISRALAARGHEVRVLGHRSLEERIKRAGADFVPYTDAPEADSSDPERDLLRDWEARTPLGAFARVRDNLMFGPALGFASDVVAELERGPADVVAFDYLLVGAGVGAEAAGVPAAVLMHTIYPLPTEGVPPFGPGLRPARGVAGRARDALLTRMFERAFAPGLRALNAARSELGLEQLGHYAEQFERADRVLVLTSPQFDLAARAELPSNVRYTGAVLDSHADASWQSPWPAEDTRPLVVAGFSTTFMDQRDLAERFLSAMDGIEARGLLTTGPAIEPGGLNAPENVEVRQWVPHGAVLPEAAAMVCHAGLGSVHAALAAGTPLICLPDGRDQDDNAVRVAEAGVGVKLWRRARATRLRRAIEDVLADARMRRAAEEWPERLRREDGAGSAAEEIEALARPP